MQDTIYALASAPGRAGVAVVRVSGPNAEQSCLALTGWTALPPPRVARLAPLRDMANGDLIDRGLVLWFQGPASFTGEDLVEFHLHGGPVVIGALVEALADLPGHRPAEPGEFTRRAFANGKLDLTQAEALADLVAAETAAQRRQALTQMSGGLGALYEGWRQRLLGMLAHIEADIDFVDEGDVPHGLSARAAEQVRGLIDEIGGHLDDSHRGERVREGLSIVILGPPNAGKSSLLNLLARRDAAIVSAIAGTTRDVVEVHLDIAGYPVVMADTAGLRSVTEEIENEGVRRALVRAADADLKLVLIEAPTLTAPDPGVLALVDDDTIPVVNKIDLADPGADPRLAGRVAVPVSARTGTGLPTLLDRLERAVVERLGTVGAPSLTRARHRKALEECRDSLTRALRAPETALLAEDLRLATRALGRITGRVDVEDVLDTIFAEFCIGK